MVLAPPVELKHRRFGRSLLFRNRRSGETSVRRRVKRSRSERASSPAAVALSVRPIAERMAGSSLKTRALPLSTRGAAPNCARRHPKRPPHRRHQHQQHHRHHRRSLANCPPVRAAKMECDRRGSNPVACCSTRQRAPGPTARSQVFPNGCLKLICRPAIVIQPDRRSAR